MKTGAGMARCALHFTSGSLHKKRVGSSCRRPSSTVVENPESGPSESVTHYVLFRRLQNNSRGVNARHGRHSGVPETVLAVRSNNIVPYERDQRHCSVF